MVLLRTVKGSIYDEHIFSERKDAVALQQKIKLDYGFKPTVFKKGNEFVIVKSHGMTKLPKK